MAFCIYVLYSLSHDIHYIGSTKDVEKRLLYHNLGFSRYTKGRRPWKVVYKEDFKTRSLAMKRERFLKSGQGREYLKRILEK